MKRIRTVNGIVSVDAVGDDFVLEKAKEILSAHRATLIRRLFSGLEDYILYKFNRKPSASQLERIKEVLMQYKDSSVDLDDHPAIREDILKKDLTVVINKTFYEEIDSNIISHLK
jgi:hypothetical protein